MNIVYQPNGCSVVRLIKIDNDKLKIEYVDGLYNSLLAL